MRSKNIVFHTYFIHVDGKGRSCYYCIEIRGGNEPDGLSSDRPAIFFGANGYFESTREINIYNPNSFLTPK